MIATATALIQATENSVMNDESMEIASFITHERNNLSQDDFAKAMFVYATAIASTAIDKATKVLLTETQLRELFATIDEMETLRNEVLSNG